MASIRELIPINFILPFLVVIFFELLISGGISYYNQSLDNQISNLEQSIKTQEEELKSKLIGNESFEAFSQFVNIIEIVKTKKSLYNVIQKFTPLIPNFVEVKKIEFDSDKNTLSLEGSVENWIDYVKLHHYFSLQPDIVLKEFKSPVLNEKTGKVDFEFTFQLKPNFYQK